MSPRDHIKQEDLNRAAEAEQLFLGALSHDAMLFDKVESIVTEGDFLVKSHAAWFKCIKRRVEAGEPVDLFTLSEELDRTSPVTGASWAVRVGEAMSAAPSSANIKHYAKIVAKYSMSRRSALVGVRVKETLGNSNLDHDERLRIAEDAMSLLGDTTSERQYLFSITEMLTQSIERVETAYASDNPIEFPFGFDTLDEMTLGAHRGDLIIVAGRPSMGKTGLAMCVAESFCNNGKAGLVVSTEMPGEQLASRMVTSVGRVDAQRYRSGKLLDDDWERITHALSRLHEYKLSIDENPLATPGSIRKSARKVLKSVGHLDFIVVDYLQLMGSDITGNHGKRGDEITEISRQLKHIAKEFNVPVIVLSQLNRNLEQRQNKRPVMSDLRESGAIEQDADLILFIYRDEVYDPDSQAKGIAEIIVGKQRNGPIGTALAAFLGAYSRFENLSRGGGY